MMSWIAAGRSGIQIINEDQEGKAKIIILNASTYVYIEVSQMTCSMCHAALPLFGIFETETYSKVTTDEALWYYLATTINLRDSRSLVHKPWRQSSVTGINPSKTSLIAVSSSNLSL